jgi:hypothetical protein
MLKDKMSTDKMPNGTTHRMEKNAEWDKMSNGKNVSGTKRQWEKTSTGTKLSRPLLRLMY